MLNIDNIELKYLNNVPFDRMVYYYNSSDVVLLTSLWEGSPNVIKEAMACNIPIVSLNIGDVNEIIKHTEGCYLAKKDPNDISIKIENALKFGKRTSGRSDIKHLSSEIISIKITDLYKSII